MLEGYTKMGLLEYHAYENVFQNSFVKQMLFPCLWDNCTIDIIYTQLVDRIKYIFE